MKRICLLALAFIIGFAATAKSRKHKKKPTVHNEIKSVNMYRTGCFGRCPQYSIEINEDGMVTYTGIQFTTDSGVYKKSIGSKQAMEVINQFIQYRVDTCKPGYENRIQDLPGFGYVIEYKDSVKKIYGANWGPGFLKLLAANMDRAGDKTDNTGWKKVNTSNK